MCGFDEAGNILLADLRFGLVLTKADEDQVGRTPWSARVPADRSSSSVNITSKPTRASGADQGGPPHNNTNATILIPRMDSLKALIREVPDFPKPGINFYDITTLLKDATGFKAVIDSLAQQYKSTPIDVVLGIEARGFIIAPAVAYALGYGFIPVRKQKKLPAERARIEYQLEYGTDVLEIHKDAISPGQNVLIIDDVLATGGTAAAVAELVETLEGKVAGLGFILELDFLKGREKLSGHEVHSLVHY